jgi:hypothetical protein
MDKEQLQHNLSEMFEGNYQHIETGPIDDQGKQVALCGACEVRILDPEEHIILQIVASAAFVDDAELEMARLRDIVFAGIMADAVTPIEEVDPYPDVFEGQ